MKSGLRPPRLRGDIRTFLGGRKSGKGKTLGEKFPNRREIRAVLDIRFFDGPFLPKAGETPSSPGAFDGQGAGGGGRARLSRGHARNRVDVPKGIRKGGGDVVRLPAIGSEVLLDEEHPHPLKHRFHG